MFFGHSESDQNWQGEDQKVAAPHAGIEQRDFFRSFGPSLERPGGGPPLPLGAVLGLVAHKAQIAPLNAAYRAGRAKFILGLCRTRKLRLARENLSCPPCAERVVQQEEDHVVLGEKLGDGGNFVSTNLPLRLVDLFLSIGLPELIDPSKTVIGDEHVTRKLFQKIFEL